MNIETICFVTKGNGCMFACISFWQVWNTTSKELRLGLRHEAIRPSRYLTHWGRENGRHFPDDIFKWIFLNENVWTSIIISLKFVSRGPINNIPKLVQLMAWRRPGDKALSEPMMARLPTHIRVTRPQWVNLLIWIPVIYSNGHTVFQAK